MRYEITGEAVLRDDDGSVWKLLPSQVSWDEDADALGDEDDSYIRCCLGTFDHEKLGFLSWKFVEDPSGMMSDTLHRFGGAILEKDFIVSLKRIE